MMIGRMILLHSQRIKDIYMGGAADMKSGLAALAIALIEIKESGKLTQELLNSWQQWVKKWNNQVRNSCLKKDMLMI